MPRAPQTTESNGNDSAAPYMRIVVELRRRIDAGELGPGDRIPTTRQLAAEWGVAMATATKALLTLRHEGRIRAQPRVGAIVARPASPPQLRAAKASPLELTRARIAQAAMAIADAEGLAAVSMRGVAAKLDVPTMSLYRHVPSKEDLVLLMTDVAFGERALPAAPPAGWRARLEQAARLQWALYRRHPWLAQAMTLTRPLALPNVMAYADWSLHAIDGLGLSAETMLNVHVTMFNLVRGVAINLESEIQAEAETGLTEQEWTDARSADFAALTASGRYPTFARVLRELSAGYDLDLDATFELALQPMLDGLRGVVEGGRRPRAPRTK